MQDLFIRAWKYNDASQRFEGVATLQGHTRTVTCMLLAGTTLLSGSLDLSIKVRS